ncbi:lefty1 precursor [Silurus asotus]|uniref:Left-right determination factor n=1 Tax=Silurus asotus TaxID=30991 RepID=A0AAD5APG7_SILAS|nr:lefty1 precursor [Silurus asotus]
MASTLTSCFFCAVVLTLGHAFTQDDMKDALLKKLGLDEVPQIHKRDLENLVVPAHVKSKYVSMLKLHHERRRRSLPSLAGILRGIPGNADISGEFVYSDTTRQRVVFEMTSRIPDNSEVTMAELKLYKKAPHKRAMPERKGQRPVNNARVSVYWVEVLGNGSNRTSLVDSRLIPIHESGWKSFDVTQAVHYWSKSERNTPMHLEVWIEGERHGSYAAEMAKSVQFSTQEPSDILGKPELVLYTLNLEEFGSQGDCEPSKRGETCCREEHFINFRALTWTQYWVIEPAGYRAFRCAGTCRQPQRAPHAYGARKCAAVESAPLPMMYLVKKGEYTEIEVAEFPNMIVEKCGCAMDNVSLV